MKRSFTLTNENEAVHWRHSSTVVIFIAGPLGNRGYNPLWCLTTAPYINAYVHKVEIAFEHAVAMNRPWLKMDLQSGQKE